MDICELTGWQGSPIAWLCLAFSAAIGVWVMWYMSKLGRRKHLGNFHGQRMYDAAGTVLGVLAFALVGMMTTQQTRNFFCGL